MKHKRVLLAIACATVVGSIALLLLAPWGDPCSFEVATPDQIGCGIIHTSLQDNLRNAVFALICVLTGAVAGSIAGRTRIIGGALSALLAAILGHFTIRFYYGVGSSAHLPWTSSMYVSGALLAVAIVALGMVGGALSKVIRLTTATSAT